MSTCAECGFAYGALARPELPEARREGARSVAARLASDGTLLRRHQVPTNGRSSSTPAMCAT